MGNRALRAQLGKLVKRFYTGHKLAAYSALPAWRLRRLIKEASVREGDLIHDCDGFNHRVESATIVMNRVGSWRYPKGSNGTYMREVDIVITGGQYRCSCSPPSPPLPREEIEKWFLSWIEYQRSSGTMWADGAEYDDMLKRLQSGLPICDEDGCPLPPTSADNLYGITHLSLMVPS